MVMSFSRRWLLVPRPESPGRATPTRSRGGERREAHGSRQAAAGALWTGRRPDRTASRRALIAVAAALPAAKWASRFPAAMLPSLDARDFTDDTGRPLRGGGDDAQCIQNAIRHAVATMGGAATIYLGGGPLTLKSPLAIRTNIRLIGDGPNATIATVAYSTAADVIAIGAGSGNPAYAGLRGIQFVLGKGENSGGGALIHCTNNHDCGIEDCVFWGAFFCMVQIDGGSRQYINYVRRCEFNPRHPNRNSAAILIGASGFPQDVWLEDLEMGGGNAGQTGILVQNVGGLQVRNVDIINMRRTGFAIYPQAGGNVANCFLDNLEVDTCAQDGTEVSGAIIGAASSGSIRDIRMTDCWFASNGHGHGASGLVVNGTSSLTIDGVHMSDCIFANNGGHGLVLGPYARNIDADNCQCADNGQARRNSYDGLVVDCSLVSIIGGRSGSNDALGHRSGTQRYGYAIRPRTDYVVLLGASAHGNETGPLENLSTGRHNTIVRPAG